ETLAEPKPRSRKCTYAYLFRSMRLLSSVGLRRVFAPASSSGNRPHLMNRDSGWRRFSSAGANYFGGAAREAGGGARCPDQAGGGGNPEAWTGGGSRKPAGERACRRKTQSTWRKWGGKAPLSSSREREGPGDSYRAKAGLPWARVGGRR